MPRTRPTSRTAQPPSPHTKMVAFSRQTVLALLCCAARGYAASFSSCGGAGDIMQNLVITMTPDPMQKGKAFTVTASGTLSAPVDSGSANVDLDAKIELLGQTLLDKKVQKTAPFAASPSIPAGPAKLVVGPVQLPGEVPGTVDITGKVVITTATGAQVACVAVDFHLALMEEVSVPALAAPMDVVKTCNQPSDHLQNFVLKQGDVVEVSGTLDEDVTAMSFEADLSLHLSVIPVPLKINVPVNFAPGIKKGPVDFKVGPVKDTSSQVSAPNAAVEVTGKILWKDGAAQEIACLELDASKASEVVV